MPQPLSGPGLGLMPPQNLYPTELFNAPYDCPTNALTLPAGASQVLPAGDWFVWGGKYCDIQFFDPVTDTWRIVQPVLGHVQFVKSDGFNVRVANLLGTVVGAVVVNGGSGYTQSTATITPSAGSSTWYPVVGGSLAVSTINNPGSGFGIAPLVYIPSPPSQNTTVPATAYATLSSGTVSAVSLVNQGAGYQAASVTALLLPSLNDPNYATASAGSVTFTLANAGAITAAVCLNPGIPLSTAPTLTPAGTAGTAATITPYILQTVTATSVAAGGAGWGNATQFPFIGSAGGAATATSAVPNPLIEFTSFVPRAFQGVGTTNAGGTISAVTIYDGGKFVTTPNSVVVPASGFIATTAASITFTGGFTTDTVYIQAAP